MSPTRQCLCAVLALIAALLFFELTPADLWLQQFLYNSPKHIWLLEHPGRILSFIFYDGVKKLLVVGALAILIALLFFRQTDIVRRYRRGLRIVLLSLIIVPAFVGALKATTNVACPRDITFFGGHIPYVRVFALYPAAFNPEDTQACFPAGHASGGFALMALYFLFRTKRNRRLGLLAGFTVGWLMGGYKMLIGHHFLSHTVVTMILAWLLINLIVQIDDFIASKKAARTSLQRVADETNP